MPTTRRPSRRPAGKAREVAVPLVVSRHPQVALYAGDDPVVAVEELVHHVRPAADVGDREEVARGRVRVRVDEVVADRAVTLRGEDLLRGGRPQVADERLRGGAARLRD